MAIFGTFAPINGDWDYRINYAADTWKPNSISANTTDMGAEGRKRASSPIYGMIRSNVGFNTSTIPAEALITAGTLMLYVGTLNKELTNQATYVVPASGTGGGLSFTLTNYGMVEWSGSAINQYFNFTLDLTKNPIVKAGTTNLGLVSYHDFNNVTPASVGGPGLFYQQTGDANPPQLIVGYETGAGLDTTSKMW